jgi:enamine deaminase RidA (YjgF/YER057c/UK114 family)
MKDILFELSAEPCGAFAARLDNLTEKLRDKLESYGLGADHLVCARTYLSDAANQWSELKAHRLFTEWLSQGAVSYVEQPPLDGSKISLMVCLSEDSIEHWGSPDKHIARCHESKQLFQSVRFTAKEAAAMTPKEQTMEAFRRHIEWLKEEGLSLRDNCMRTWLFVRDIDKNYQAVVEGRNEVFRHCGLTSETHYIASTGIGGNGENPAAVCVDFWSVDDKNLQVKYLQALDHLNPTHEYGVAFERGTSFSSDGVQRLLISGTASIDRAGNCLFHGDVLKQADRLFENISYLLADGGASLNEMSGMNVYLRDLSDYIAVKTYLDTRFPNVPRVISLAPVCRPLWLIETECLVSRKDK